LGELATNEKETSLGVGLIMKGALGRFEVKDKRL